MKKIWFRRKRYGLGWTPATLEGWAILGLYLVLFVLILVRARYYVGSGDAVLLNVIVPIFVLTGILMMLTWKTGESLKWQWGKDIPDMRHTILRGGIAVIPTDTTYGIVGSAFHRKTVNRIYELRKRDLDKPFIILIGDIKQMRLFGIMPTAEQQKTLDRVWPGAVSVILSCEWDKFAYLHRGKHTLAFRLPKDEGLRKLLKDVGPLVAPSANPQGHGVAKTVEEARAYFGHHVDFYEDGGLVTASPSRIIDVTSGVEKVIR